ncbi:MAG: pantoate--beta-alanine ligase, partial [Clostridia bacterium]|nr:pantoate--beta-alanine ligase [Clostridia bacterium]
MKISRKVLEMQELCEGIRSEGKKIGFVPTMGYFHRGHLSLMEAAVKENDFTAVSIFVNPTQFGENEDYDTYPRDLEGDMGQARRLGVDVIFAPHVGEMYPHGYGSYVEVEGITEIMCGASRPGHFRGVTTVVSKLFNIVLPHRVYFGQKDIQQALIIRKMISELNFPLNLRILPTIREADGLAMSSRNAYLSREERKAALVVPQSLQAALKMMEKGEKSKGNILGVVREIIEAEPRAKIDYITVRDMDTLGEVDSIEDGVVVAAAVWIGKTRLIDNITWGE